MRLLVIFRPLTQQISNNLQSTIAILKIFHSTSWRLTVRLLQTSGCCKVVVYINSNNPTCKGQRVTILQHFLTNIKYYNIEHHGAFWLECFPILISLKVTANADVCNVCSWSTRGWQDEECSQWLCLTSWISWIFIFQIYAHISHSLITSSMSGAEQQIIDFRNNAKYAVY